MSITRVVFTALYYTNAAFREKVRELLGLTDEDQQKGNIKGLEEFYDLTVDEGPLGKNSAVACRKSV